MSRSRRQFLDSLWIGLLILYVLAGVVITPFHGDESTIIFMSRDFDTLLSGQASALHYRIPATDDPAAQDLRLLNGNLIYYSIGLLRSLADIGVEDLNQQWDWSADYQQNVAVGHLPSPPLLFVARLWSALCTALSAAVMFAIGRRLGGRQLAWLTVLCYALLPTMLLNGRRATYEGAVLLATAFILLMALIIITHLRSYRMKVRYWLLFGLACGVAVAIKHNLLLVVTPLMLNILVVDRRRSSIVGLFLVGVAMTLTFFVLNPAWWSFSPELPGEVLRLRADILRGQIQAFGGFPAGVEGWTQRIAAALTLIFTAPQYYEVNAGWVEWIGSEIVRYERSGLAGIVLPSIVWLFTLVIGVIMLRTDALGWLWRGVAAIVLVALILINPLPWQRYYLPLVPFAAVFCAAGIDWLIKLVINTLTGRVHVRPA
jgi:4-amino-4-deoxy-L-arabinose transferase-like glycosyltransferase